MNWLYLILYILWNKFAYSKPISTNVSQDVLNNRKNNISMSTFKTSILRNDIESATHASDIFLNNNRLPNISQQPPSIIDFTEIKFNYDNKKYYFFGLLFLFLIMPLGIVLWCLKKLIKLCFKKLALSRIFKTGRKDDEQLFATPNVQNEPKASESALSGECGCVFRIHKDTLSKLKDKNKSNDSVGIGKGNFILKNYFFSTNNGHNLFRQSLSQLTMKSNGGAKLECSKSAACVLITFKNSEPMVANNVCLNCVNKKPLQSVVEDRYEGMLSCLDKKNRAPKFQSEEDLSDYMEFTQKSLLDIRNSLNYLDKI